MDVLRAIAKSSQQVSHTKILNISISIYIQSNLIVSGITHYKEIDKDKLNDLMIFDIISNYIIGIELITSIVVRKMELKLIIINPNIFELATQEKW